MAIASEDRFRSKCCPGSDHAIAASPRHSRRAGYVGARAAAGSSGRNSRRFMVSTRYSFKAYRDCATAATDIGQLHGAAETIRSPIAVVLTSAAEIRGKVSRRENRLDGTIDRSAASVRPSHSSIIAAERIVAIGFAIPCRRCPARCRETAGTRRTLPDISRRRHAHPSDQDRRQDRREYRRTCSR